VLIREKHPFCRGSEADPGQINVYNFHIDSFPFPVGTVSMIILKILIKVKF
jgi:hypothetical protein